MHKAKMILWGTVCIFFWVKYPSCLTGTAHKFWIFVEKRQLLLLASCSFPLLFNVGMASPLFHYITCQLVTALKQATTLTLQNEFTTSFANIFFTVFFFFFFKNSFSLTYFLSFENRWCYPWTKGTSNSNVCPNSILPITL